MWLLVCKPGETYFYLADPGYRDVTIGQMLSHLSGIPDVEDYEWNNPRYDQGALKQYIRSLSAEKLISTPGEEYHYSNMAYDILAAVVAEVSGMPFEDYISANILDPAGMTCSTFLRKNVPDSLSVAPHVYDFTNFRMGVSPVYPYNRIHAGSSTLHSNVEDMIRWAFVNLYHGKTEGGRILQESSYDSLWNERFPIGEERFIGLSWFISRYHDKTVISHGGGDTGFRSYLLLIPEDTTAVVTMGNSENFQSYGIVRMILDLLYDFPPETPRSSASFSFLSLWGKQGVDSAFRYFKHLIKNPDPTIDFDDGSLITLALPLIREGKRDLALELLNYNNQLFPESIWNYQFRAEVLYQMGRKEEAILSLQKALQQDPDNTYTLTLLNQYSSD